MNRFKSWFESCTEPEHVGTALPPPYPFPIAYSALGQNYIGFHKTASLPEQLWYL